MKEYAEVDRYAAVEDRVDQLLPAGADTSDGIQTKKKDSEKHRVTARVHPDTKAAFKRAVDDDDRFNSYGAALAHAVSVYHDGGRASRLEDKLDRVLESVEDGSVEAAAGTDADSTEEPSPEYGYGIDDLPKRSDVKKRLANICDELPEGGFLDSELVEAVKSEGIQSEKQIREEYRPTVTDLLNVERHPSNPDLWIPEDDAKELVGDTPGVCNRAVSDLSRDEKVRRIKLEVGVRTMKGNKPTNKVSGDDIKYEILDNEVGDATVRELVSGVCDAPGFWQKPDRDSSMDVRMNARKVAKKCPDLTDDIKDYVDEKYGDEDDDEESVEEQMNQITSAEPVTSD